MADAKKCDRCKNYYDNYKIKLKETEVKNRTVHYYPVDRIKLGNALNTYCGFDVCPECMKEFFEFIRVPNEMFDFGGDDA